MKDLQLGDIIPRGRSRYTKVSVYFKGQWQFASLSNPVVVEEGQSFFKINYKFGLVKSNQTNPAKYVMQGSPGDYVALDGLGELALIKKEQFKSKFPVKDRNPKRMPPTSASLTNPKYITEIAKGSEQTSSNTRPARRYTPSAGGSIRRTSISSPRGSSGGSSGGGGGGGY